MPERWEQRYTAVRTGFPAWSDTAPDRLAVVSNRSGSWQAWAHDLATGGWRQASDEPMGVEEVRMLPDGRIAWFQDDIGLETGRWRTQAFEGGEVATLFPDLPTGWSLGMSMAAGGRAAVGLEVGGEYRVYVVETDGTHRLVYVSGSVCGVGGAWDPSGHGLSPDGRTLVLLHTEHGDILRPALRLLDLDAGDHVLAEIDDRPRKVEAGPWSADGSRFAFANELGDRARPSVIEAGTRRDLTVDLPGDVYPVAWEPDACHLLVRHEFEARSTLHRIDTDSGALGPIADPGGDIGDAAIRPDGEVWFHGGDPSSPPGTRDAAGVPVFDPDPTTPGGSPIRDVWTENAHGDRIHALLVTPDGDGPFPTVVNVHGGPEWHQRPVWDPEILAYVDAGYAVVSPNYRGSTGYGVAHREALIGNVCWTETEDIEAVIDQLIADGVADPDRLYWSGWSWGGCLACFNAGVHPRRYRAIFAGIPGGDFVAAHEACAPELQAWDVAVYGGSPDEVPEAYARSNPITYVSDVVTPTIVIAGEHDPRCPIEGVTPWVEAVRAAGTEVEVHTYAAGHHANGMDQQVEHMRLVLDFFARH
jgi:dipeptidyl aminopeptidase/acylaminoacyl peptidase